MVVPAFAHFRTDAGIVGLRLFMTDHHSAFRIPLLRGYADAESDVGVALVVRNPDLERECVFSRPRVVVVE